MYINKKSYCQLHFRKRFKLGTFQANVSGFQKEMKEKEMLIVKRLDAAFYKFVHPPNSLHYVSIENILWPYDNLAVLSNEVLNSFKEESCK